MTPENQTNTHHSNTWNWNAQKEKNAEKELWYNDHNGAKIHQEPSFTIIRPGIYMGIFRTDAGTIPSYHFDIQQMPVGFSFQLTGKIEVNWQQSRNKKMTTTVFQRGDSTVLSMNQTRGYSRYAPNDMFSSVALFITPEVLADTLLQGRDNLPDDCCKLLDQKTPIFKSLPMTTDLYRVTNMALHHPYHGALERLHLESCALSLLVMQIDRLAEKGFTRKKSLTQKDKECIRAAADILDQQLVNPPTIATLSRQVGVNESKLKWGFKEIFGQTIFQFVLCQRMNLARELILTKDMDVSQTPFAVGYRNISHFINGYKKIFGVTPGYEKHHKHS